MDTENKLIENLNNEIFCLKYELDAISDLTIHNRAERWVKGFMFPRIEKEHEDRYDYILQRVAGKEVLDIACGSGYGTYLLAHKGNASKVVGVDLNDQAVKYGNHRYSHPNIKRIVGDATEVTFEKQFDVVVSFETIEHIPHVQKFVQNIYQNLKVGGILAISTPVVIKTTETPFNPFHIVEWSHEDFLAIFKNQYELETVILQNPVFQIRKNSWLLRCINYLIKSVGFKKQIPTVYYGAEFEKLTGQYNMKNCFSGYQMLVLKKK